VLVLGVAAGVSVGVLVRSVGVLVRSVGVLVRSVGAVVRRVFVFAVHG
jgi:hypothetical protein